MSYKDLDVYKRSYELAKKVHYITQTFPSIEKHELGSQLRRSAMSIVLNIAEGYGRKASRREFQHFLRNALGSCNEVRVILEFCRDFKYIDEPVYKELEKKYEANQREKEIALLKKEKDLQQTQLAKNEIENKR